MKVSNIIEEGRFGGPQKRIGDVAEKLSSDGIETLVIAPANDSENFQAYLQSRNVAAEWISLHRLTKDLSHLIRYIIFFIPEVLSIRRILKSESIDLVHANGAWQIKGLIAAKLSGRKIVWHLNDTFMPAFIRIPFQLFFKKLADGYIFACERSKQYYFPSGRISKLSSVIQAPVDISFFNPDTTDPHQHLKVDTINIVCVGNINPVKDPMTFLKAAESFNKKSGKSVQFTMIGKKLSNQKELLNTLLAYQKERGIDNFEFYGGSTEIRNFLKAADIYVCSSAFEASPISVWEAMAMAKPIVATDVGDLRTIVEKNHVGIVVPTGDADALSNALIELVDDEKRRLEMGVHARKVAREYLSLEICTKKHYEFYHRIVNINDNNRSSK